MWKRRSDHVPSEPAPTIGPELHPTVLENEFDAYIAGDYVGWLQRHDLAVPAWAHLNRLAHATLEELEEISTTAPPPGDDTAAAMWAHVSMFLARELLALVATPEELEVVRADVLVPLELDLANEWWALIAPIDMATAVMLALQPTTEE
jgi:hypothetical protein